MREKVFSALQRKGMQTQRSRADAEGFRLRLKGSCSCSSGAATQVSSSMLKGRVSNSEQKELGYT